MFVWDKWFYYNLKVALGEEIKCVNGNKWYCVFFGFFISENGVLRFK